MNSRVTVEFENHIAHVRLSRPEKLNALDGDMIQALVAAGDRVAKLRGLRVVVLSGAGDAFCAGIDLDVLKQSEGRRGEAIDIATRDRGMANTPQHVALQWRSLPVPVIAAVHGSAFGGGLQLCLGADIRLLHPATRLGLIEVKWGLVPDMCGMLLLRDLVRPDVLAEMIYAARVFDAATARVWGIATRLCDDPLAAAFELAREIAGKSPDAVRAAKRLLTLSDQTMAQRILKAESDEQSALFGSANQREAVRAGLERRPGVYADEDDR